MIHKNDTVMVISGKEKGKTGKVLAVFPSNNRATVEKLNIVKRHQKPNQKLKQGGIVEKEASVHISNLMVYCSKCRKPVRIGAKVDKDGKKTRNCKKCGEKVGQ
ncbi:MAG: 50S ribosomal protein L24 [bacterium]|nr:50S ribosomal protein L24 [bacterium]